MADTRSVGEEPKTIEYDFDFGELARTRMTDRADRVIWDCGRGADSRTLSEMFGRFAPTPGGGKRDTQNNSAFICRIIRPTSR
jgi:hypothetical protein